MMPDGQKMPPLWRLDHMFAYIQPAAQKGPLLRRSVVVEAESFPEQVVQFFQKMPDQSFSERAGYRAERGGLAFSARQAVYGPQHLQEQAALLLRVFRAIGRFGQDLDARSP